MRAAGIVVMGLLAGCGNACEKLCENMADYASECGFAVPDADIETCKAAQEAATPEDEQVCEDYGTPESIRAEWTCDDLQAYWDATTSDT